MNPTSSKDLQVTRPQSQHRQSTVPSGLSVPARHSTARQHSHTVSLGSINHSYRVTRRRSNNATSVNHAAAVRAILQDLNDVPSADSLPSSSHQSVERPTQNFERIGVEGKQQSGSDAIDDPFTSEQVAQNSAVAEGFASENHPKNISLIRARRASEGSHLIKSHGKRSGGQLRCDICGKVYKHSSCLTKHHWEHDPAWAFTSKLLISKHQQVQLLEAATVLVNMNADEPEADNIRTSESDLSSSSPAASGSSYLRDEIDDVYSSAETTPPPMGDQYGLPIEYSTGRGKTYSGMSSSYSRSYQSAPSGSIPASNSWSHYNSQSRPSTSGYATGMTKEEEGGLAAAVETLCSFGTPRTGPVLLPPDAPPVPPLPAHYTEKRQRKRIIDVDKILGYPDFGLPSPTYQPLSNERDVRMGDEVPYKSHEDQDHDAQYGLHSGSDEDEGVFGGMEGIAHEAHQELSHD